MSRSTLSEMCLLMLLFLGCLLAGPAASQDAAPATTPEPAAEPLPAEAERDWFVAFTPYVWVVSINGDIEGDVIDSSYGVDIVEILKHLKGLAMADLVVRYKRVGVFGDGMWSRLSTSDSRSIPGGSVDIDLTLNMAFGTGAGFYQFRPTEKLSLEPYIGARWWRMNTELGLDDNGGLLGSRSVEVTTTWADPIFGLRANYAITDKWSFRVLGDVGGGVSKVSWQALVGGGYQFTDWFAFDLVYRVMGVNYEPNDTQFKLKLSGLVTGFRFQY